MSGIFLPASRVAQSFADVIDDLSRTAHSGGVAAAVRVLVALSKRLLRSS